MLMAKIKSENVRFFLLTSTRDEKENIHISEAESGDFDFISSQVILKTNPQFRYCSCSYSSKYVNNWFQNII